MARKSPEKGASHIDYTIRQIADHVHRSARSSETRLIRATRTAIAATLLGTLAFGAGCASPTARPLHKIADEPNEANKNKDEHPHGYADPHAENFNAHGGVVLGQGSYDTHHGKEGYGVAEQHAEISGPLGTAGAIHWAAAIEALEQNTQSGPGGKPPSSLRPLDRSEAGGRVGVKVSLDHFDARAEGGILGQRYGGIEDGHGKVKDQDRVLGTSMIELKIRPVGSHHLVVPFASTRSWVSQGQKNNTNQTWVESNAGFRVTDEVLPEGMNADFTAGFDFRREQAGGLQESVRTLIAGTRIDLFDAFSVAIEGGRVLGGYSRTGHERTAYGSGWAARIGAELDISKGVEIIAEQMRRKR